MVNQDNDTSRIEAFSDRVFAIAITLLVIEIGVPHLGDEPEGTTLFGALVDRWPSYLGYVISFLVIGTVWANHHNRFRFIVRSNHALLFILPEPGERPRKTPGSSEDTTTEDSGADREAG